MVWVQTCVLLLLLQGAAGSETWQGGGGSSSRWVAAAGVVGICIHLGLGIAAVNNLLVV
jgi:hypothetical protein